MLGGFPSLVARIDAFVGHFGGQGQEILERRRGVGLGGEDRVEDIGRQRTAERHAHGGGLHRLEVTIHLADRADGGRRDCRSGMARKAGRSAEASHMHM